MVCRETGPWHGGHSRGESPARPSGAASVSGFLRPRCWELRPVQSRPALPFRCSLRDRATSRQGTVTPESGTQVCASDCVPHCPPQGFFQGSMVQNVKWGRRKREALQAPGDFNSDVSVSGGDVWSRVSRMLKVLGRWGVHCGCGGAGMGYIFPPDMPCGVRRRRENGDFRKQES